MELIKKCENELRKLKNCKNIKERRQIIRNSDNCLIDAISEIAKNCILGNLKLKNCEFNKIKQFRRPIEKLSKKIPIEKRKNIIIQKGGFLNILIPATLFLLDKFMK